MIFSRKTAQSPSTRRAWIEITYRAESFCCPGSPSTRRAWIEITKERTDKPSVIICRTRIGYGSPLEGSEKSHGAPLGAENLKKSKEKLGWKEEDPFSCPKEVYEHCALAANAGAEKEMQWKKMFAEYEYTYPELAQQYKDAMAGKKPDFAAMEDLYSFDKPMATRGTSSVVLNKIAANLPSLFAGSADLAPSNQSVMKDTDTMKYGTFSAENYAGRNVHFGIREHAMAAICNGLQLHGGVQAYCATIFVFTDYCKPALRLAALMGLPVTYIFTHDSIGVGEDGPTHQPIEHVSSLRLIPDLLVWRPCDAVETAVAWKVALESAQPSCMVLTRQGLTPQIRTEEQLEAVKRGAYILKDCEGTPDVILIATGSEVQLTVSAAEALAGKGRKARVVSMPCAELFDAQPAEYKENVLPRAVRARVAVEAASVDGWWKYVGLDGAVVGMSGFGESAPGDVLFKHFGFTVDHVVDVAEGLLK